MVPNCIYITADGEATYLLQVESVHVDVHVQRQHGAHPFFSTIVLWID